MGFGKYNNVPRYLREDVISDKDEIKKSKNMFDRSGPWYARKAAQIRKVVEDIKRVMESPE